MNKQNNIPIFTLNIPEYQVDEEPDDKAIGKLLDDEIKKHFLGQSILVRGIASSEHPTKTVEELIEIIQRLGTDRYDPERIGDRYDNLEGKHIDLFGFPATITDRNELMNMLVWGFYHSAIAIHGYPMRIDIITVYDAKQMERVVHQYEGREDIKDDGFAFKDPSNKPAALKAIIKITDLIGDNGQHVVHS